MKAILEKISPFRTILVLVGMGLIILIIANHPVKADLSGSYVAFTPSEGGSACFVPNRPTMNQSLYFTAQTTTSDGQDTAALFVQLPSDWTVWTVSNVSTSCSNSGSISYLGFAGYSGPGGYALNDSRVQNSIETCTAVYNLGIRTGATTYSNASMGWAWISNDTTKVPPLSPCSSDGYNPLGTCDIAVSPPAVIPVCPHLTLDILPTTLPAAEVGSYYSEFLTAEGADGPYTWSAMGLPPGISLDYSTGVLSGTPTTAGAYNITVNVKGSDWSDGTRDYTLTVYPTLTFNPTGLPTTRLTQSYTQAITLTGGSETYTLAHTAGTLPAGISFTDGTFSGIPTETGTFGGIVIEADYGTGLIKTKTYSLTVLPEHVFTWSPDQPNEGYKGTFTAIPGYSGHLWSYSAEPGEPCSVYSFFYTQIVDIYFGPSGEYQVCLSFYDAFSNLVTDSQWLTVANVAPEIYDIVLFQNPSFPGVEVSGFVDFYDPDQGPFDARINWGDGSAEEDFYLRTPENWHGLPLHIYSDVGTYTVQVWITDIDGETSTETAQLDVVYVAVSSQPENKLASNTHPTTLDLFGFTIEGHTPLNFNIVSPPTQGTLGDFSLDDCYFYDDETLYACKANVVYTPPSTLYTGPDSFSYSVDDGMGNVSSAATINMWVDENTAPIAHSDSVTVSGTQPSSFVIIANDPDFNDWLFDEISFFIDTLPTHGTLVLTEDLNCDFDMSGMICSTIVTYTPDPDTTASTDSFTFYVNDRHQDSSPATISLSLHTPVTLIVNTTDDTEDGTCDESHCSLREAVQSAIIGDVIEFDLDFPETIYLFNGEILINKDITLNGPGADQLSVSGDEYSRVFKIDGDGMPVTATISGLTIVDGRADSGGGFLITEHTTLTMNDCVIGPNNIVTYAGGGVFNEGGTLTMNNCTVTGNEGTGTLGGAGVTTVGWSATTTLVNSTIRGNITNNFGGGIYVAFDGLVTLIHSTVTENISNANYLDKDEERGGGAGIFIETEGLVEIQNSIVAGNTDMSDPATALHDQWHDVYGPVTSLGGNLIGDNTGSSGWVGSDLVGTAASPLDPGLDTSLELNAPSATPTHALLSGSPAIDAVNCLEDITADQRGIPRPQGSLCDIGSYELEQASTVGSLKIIKAFNSLTSGFTGSFTIHYDCSDGTTHDGSILLAAGGFTTISGIPVGTICTVTEDALPTPPAGWVFSTPAFNPISGEITIAEAGQSYEVTVTNAISLDPYYYKIFFPVVYGN